MAEEFSPLHSLASVSHSGGPGFNPGATQTQRCTLPSSLGEWTERVPRMRMKSVLDMCASGHM